MTAGTTTDPQSFRPRRRADVVRRGTSDETLLYDPHADAVHVLNQTALAVWDLCDGNHTAGDIEAELRRRFTVGAGNGVAENVHLVLDRFDREQLFEKADGER